MSSFSKAKDFLRTLFSHSAWLGVAGIAAVLAAGIAVVALLVDLRFEQIESSPSSSATREEPMSAASPQSQRPLASSDSDETISRAASEPESRSQYWRAESFYRVGNYSQATEAYLRLLDSLDPRSLDSSSLETIEEARKARYEGKEKLAADLARSILAPLAAKGRFGPPS